MHPTCTPCCLARCTVKPNVVEIRRMTAACDVGDRDQQLQPGIIAQMIEPETFACRSLWSPYCPLGLKPSFRSRSVDRRRHARPVASISSTVYTIITINARNIRQEWETMYLEIAIVIVLTLIHGLLALSELAIVSARPARLKLLADKGSKGAVTRRCASSSPRRIARAP